MKELYSFTLFKKGLKTEIEETPKGKLSKEVPYDQPIRVVLKKPSRAESEAAEEEFAAKWNYYIKKGLITNALVSKLYSGEDGFLSKQQEEEFSASYLRLFDIQKEYKFLESKPEKTKEESEKLALLTNEWRLVQEKLQELQGMRNSLFENTAETKAQTHVITWLVLTLAYWQEENWPEPKPLFSGNSMEEKLKAYDSILESEDDFMIDLVNRAILYISLWYLRKAETKEDFQEYEESLKQPLIGVAEPEEKSDEKEEAAQEKSEIAPVTAD